MKKLLLIVTVAITAASAQVARGQAIGELLVKGGVVVQVNEDAIAESVGMTIPPGPAGYTKFTVTQACVDTDECKIHSGSTLSLVQSVNGGTGLQRDHCVTYTPGFPTPLTSFTCTSSTTAPCHCRIIGVWTRK